ncbi:MAG: hypothetical protein A2X12_07035 [Bacteroidetes bacterium GWE2_29_8]|nr:MAG: hypothetical protein A2X12_07035 [Bacteroidetes bacterium GWE2_29_8]OFY16752.1 MAG: hypothetical protein A2X02_09260 [Bacteroidetes bacterium GWF2_29_10]
MKQYEAVIFTLEKLGGVATLGQLNQEVFKINDCIWKTKTPFASIRRIVQYDKNIYKIKPGLYALVSHRKELENKGIIQETEKNKDSKAIKEFNHSYFQGLLLIIGKLKGFETFVPNQDKNRSFVNEKLGDIRTLNELPLYTHEVIVKKSSTIDVIWFNERKMPNSFFEVEHSTDIQSSLLKFNELQDFNSRMVIVADEKRENEYLQKIKYTSFKELISPRKRVSFLGYESLNKQYESLIESQNFKFIL